MEDSGIEDGGDQNGDNLKNSGTSSGRSSIGHSPTAPRISSLDELIQILGDKDNTNQKQPETLHDDTATKLNLIPIDRLQIPGSREKQPLVQWESDDSEEDIINFFPASRKDPRVHQEISDTFSIEEMSISGGEDEDEEDLHLIPPQKNFAKFSCCQCSSCTIV
ncbi:uncharacterized protein LOC123307689 [Coccinella septempunctata]|uniref:uncharacterized protein LOC123307689 n=1 Tax=Coccinella septempunctata TaxID=41139 RepID=UPI001D071116|nr:uncharacterized protein LOC123307689 [Coccinella septempunctata]